MTSAAACLSSVNVKSFTEASNILQLSFSFKRHSDANVDLIRFSHSLFLLNLKHLILCFTVLNTELVREEEPEAGGAECHTRSCQGKGAKGYMTKVQNNVMVVLMRRKL